MFRSFRNFALGWILSIILGIFMISYFKGLPFSFAVNLSATIFFVMGLFVASVGFCGILDKE